jgi:ketosteroid isomerase-like protein
MNSSCKVWFCIALCALLTTPVAADEEEDRAALRELVTKYETAVETSDPKALAPYLSNDFSGVMVTGEEVDSFDSLNAFWQKVQGLLGQGGTYRVKVNVDERATIIGDIAFAHGTTEDTAITSENKEYRFQGFWTAICRREEEGWKIVRIHGSMDALTNTFVASAIKASAVSSALLGAVVGLFIGCVAWWIWARRGPKSPA